MASGAFHKNKMLLKVPWMRDTFPYGIVINTDVPSSSSGRLELPVGHSSLLGVLHLGGIN